MHNPQNSISKGNECNRDRSMQEVVQPVLNGEMASMVVEGSSTQIVEDGSKIHFKEPMLSNNAQLGTVNAVHPACSPRLNPLRNMRVITKTKWRRRQRRANMEDVLCKRFWRRGQPSP